MSTSTQQLLKEAERLAKNPKTKAQALELMKQLKEHLAEEKEEQRREQEEQKKQQTTDSNNNNNNTDNNNNNNDNDDEEEEEDNSGENQMYSALMSLPGKYQHDALNDTEHDMDDDDDTDAYMTSPTENCVVSITNLPLGMEEGQLKEFFEQIAPVVSVRLLRSSKTGQSQGMAFVRFTDQEIAEMICTELDYYLVLNKVIRVRMSTIPVQKHDQLFRDASIPFLRRLAMTNLPRRKLEQQFKLKQAQKKTPVSDVSKIVQVREKRMIKKQQKWNKRGIAFNVDLKALAAQSTAPPVAVAPTTAAPTTAAATPKKNTTTTTTTVVTPKKSTATTPVQSKTTPVAMKSAAVTTPQSKTTPVAMKKTTPASAKRSAKK